jgi:hypothetical protein
MDTDVVKCLLSSGADINLCDEVGHSPLFIASCKGECASRKLISAPELIKYLTTSQCPCIDAVNNGDCPFSSRKLISALELNKHLTTSHSPLHLCDEVGHSPFFIASLSGHCNVVKCLLSSGADINLLDELGRSPLFAGSCKGECDASWSHKLISAPELSKHLTTLHSPLHDAINNGECPTSSRKLISAPELSKHLTTSQCRYQFT